MSRIIRANQTQPTVLWVMLLAILLVYLSFPTKNTYWDGIDFAHTIESASRVDTSLVHSNHLIFNLVGYLFYKPSLRWLRSLQRNQQHRKLVLLSLSWFLVYLIFLFFWIPQNTFYRLFYLPALIVLAGVVVTSSTSRGSHERKYRLALLVAAVSLANFLFLIFPNSHEEKYPPLAFAREMGKAWPAGTVVYYAMDNSDNSLVRYFNPATNWKSLDSMKPAALENELYDIYSKGAAAGLDYSAIDHLSSTPDGAAWLSRHAKQESRRELVNQAFKIRFVQIVPDIQ
jgi:hypothetical protein